MIELTKLTCRSITRLQKGEQIFEKGEHGKSLTAPSSALVRLDNVAFP